MQHTSRSEPDDALDPRAAASYLSTLVPGEVPRPIFDELARIMVLPTLEVALLRLADSGHIEILLTKRPKGDVWADLWHVTGTVLRASDRVTNGADYADALKRILGSDGEAGASMSAVSDLIVVGTERRKTLRGDELSVISYLEVAGKPTVGRFFRVDDIPYNIPDNGIVPHHPSFIRRVAQDFLIYKSANNYY